MLFVSPKEASGGQKVADPAGETRLCGISGPFEAGISQPHRWINPVIFNLGSKPPDSTRVVLSPQSRFSHRAPFSRVLRKAILFNPPQKTENCRSCGFGKHIRFCRFWVSECKALGQITVWASLHLGYGNPSERKIPSHCGVSKQKDFIPSESENHKGKL